MKAFLLFLLIAAASAQKLTFEDGPTAMDFVKGFLKGIGESKSIDDLEKCINDVQAIIVKIMDALELIKTLEIGNLMKGVTDLIAALKDLSAAFKPCSAGYQVLQKLLNAITNLDFNKVVSKLIKYSIFYIGYITSAFNCFNSGQYQCLGENIGMLLKSLFIDDIEQLLANNAEAFLKGFFEGLGVHVDINAFQKCVKDVERVVEAIKKAFEAIKTKNLAKIIEGVKHLIDAARDFLNDLKPCGQNVEIIKKLIEKLQHVDIKKIGQHILAHISQVVEIIIHTTNCFQSKDYFCIGKGFGAILKIALF